jgi:hypothetical protein
MLDAEGKISFVSELMDLVEQFVVEYESRKGPLRNELERGLVISYVLGVMSCDLECIWDCLGQAPAFGSLHPRVVFQDCLGKDSADGLARREALKAELRRRGWCHDNACQEPVEKSSV